MKEKPLVGNGKGTQKDSKRADCEVLHQQVQNSLDVIECLSQSEDEELARNAHQDNAEDCTSMSTSGNVYRRTPGDTRGVAHKRCSTCNKSFKTNAGLYKHRQSKHPHMIRSFQHIHCQECNCNFRCKTLIQLRKHLEIHSLKMNTFVKTFKDVKGTFVYNF